MRIWTKAGDLAFKTFTFPDGQPHFKLETYERDFQTATVEMAIKNPVDLLTLALVNDVLRQHGYSEINLDIRYLMGARMDRAIDTLQPYTLQVVSRFINSLGLSKVRILDVHSEVATRLIRNSSNVLPYKIVQQVAAALPGTVIVVPDKGATNRVLSLVGVGTGLTNRAVLYCEKVRDIHTGALSGFKVVVPFPFDNYDPFKALIIDDICDGGGTFVGLAEKLRATGAKEINLFVTHGIFSKGLPLEGIDRIYTTDSYCDSEWRANYKAVVIPISMKDIP